MSEENLRKQLEIDVKLKLIKEHKCCSESILCIETYMYRLEQENQQLKEQLQLKKQELNGFVTTISEYLEFEEFEHTTYDEIIEKIVELKGSKKQLKQRDEVIDDVIKHVQSLSSKGRDCMIYADVKKEILDILKKYKKEGN